MDECSIPLDYQYFNTSIEKWQFTLAFTIHALLNIQKLNVNLFLALSNAERKEKIHEEFI